MIKREWKELGHNKLMLLVVIAIILIPIIYSGLFLRSMWDPYGSLEHLPVAVVNEDQPVDYEGKTLQVGEDMVEELRDNESLAFNFVDKQVAADGLRNGTYYMVITIPENFSKNASTLMDEKPQKMELDYATNPGTNYIASKMSETALTKIKDSVASEVTKVYTESVFDAIGEAGDGMQEAADGSRELKDGLADASDGNETITENLETLASSTLTFQDGAETLSKGLKEYTDGVAQVNDGAKELRDGVGTLVSSLPQMTSGTTQLNEGVKEYTGGVAKLHENSDALTSGTKDLKDGAKELNSGAKTLKSGTSEYVSGVNQLSQGLLGTEKQTGYIDGVEQLAAGAGSLAQLSDGLTSMYEAVVTGNESTPKEQTLSYGIAAVNTGVETLYNSTDNLEKLLVAAKGGLTLASAGLGETADAYTACADELQNDTIPQIDTWKGNLDLNRDNLQGILSEVNTDVGGRITTSAADIDAVRLELATLCDGAESVSATDLASIVLQLDHISGDLAEANTSFSGYSTEMDDVFTSISREMTNRKEYLTEVQEGFRDLAVLQSGKAIALDGLGAPIGDGAAQITTDVKPSIQQLYGGTQALNAGVNGEDGLAAGLTTIVKGDADSKTPSAVAGIAQLNAGFKQLTANDATLKSGATQLLQNGSALTKGTSTLASGTSQLYKGSKTLNSGVKEYTAGISELNKNSKALTDGTKQLADGAKTLGSGATQLRSGTVELYSGTSQLKANNYTLNSGATQLAEGAGQIQDGSQQLYEGSQELGNGMSKLEDGSTTLTNSLKDGADEVKAMKTSDDTISMFASPVEDTEQKITEVPNNGHAMAPYMMSVGLWVGALAFCLLYPLTQYKGKLKSGVAWWASKATVLYTVAILQALVMIGLLHLFNDFTPARAVQTAVFACLASLTFTSIMYFFNSTFGKVGSFLMLVFMVIQLAGSAGTYPVEISPGFVATIHKYLPFTYTVDAFRSTIAGGESIMPSVVVLIGIFIVFTVITILEFQHKTKAVRAGKFVLFDWLEERGLA